MEGLIKELIDEGYLKTKRIIDAFRTVHRADFLPDGYKEHASENRPVPIGYNQTISQPLTVAYMLELLQPRAGHQVLDIGAGSGWQTALLAEIVGPKGHVYGIERIPDLQRAAVHNIGKYKYDNVTMVIADGTRGYKKAAPFDGIIVAAAAEIGIPDILLQQMKVGGRLVIPVGKYEQTMVMKEKKTETDFIEERHPGFQFVPLVPKKWGDE